MCNTYQCKLSANLICSFFQLIKLVIVQHRKLLIFITLCAQCVWTLVQQPTVECFTDGLRLHFTPESQFHGHIYVQGSFTDEQCHVDYTQNPVDAPFCFDVLYNGRCHVRCEVKDEPRGINYNVVVIVQHHHLFLTHADRAYSINCFHPADSNNLARQMEIDGLTTTHLGGEIMNHCAYEVLMQSVDGEPVRYAKVGDPLIHKWSCGLGELKLLAPQNYGMLIHSCSVRESGGASFQLVDNQGCVTDKTLMNPLTYSDDLTVAYTVVPAFKFADQLTINFQCKVTLCNKARNGCGNISPPNCEALPTAIPTSPIPVLIFAPIIPTSTPQSLITTSIYETSQTPSSILETEAKYATDTSTLLPPSFVMELLCSNVIEINGTKMCDDPVVTDESTIYTTTPERTQTSYRKKRSLNKLDGTTSAPPQALFFQANSTITTPLTLEVSTDELVIFESDEMKQEDGAQQTLPQTSCELLQNGMLLLTVIFGLLTALLLAVIFVQKLYYNRRLAKCKLILSGVKCAQQW